MNRCLTDAQPATAYDLVDLVAVEVLRHPSGRLGRKLVFRPPYRSTVKGPAGIDGL